MDTLAKSPVIVMPPSKREIICAAQSIYRAQLHKELSKSEQRLAEDCAYLHPQIRLVEGTEGEAIGLMYVVDMTGLLLRDGQVVTWDFSRQIERSTGKIIGRKFIQACESVNDLVKLKSISELASLTPYLKLPIPEIRYN